MRVIESKETVMNGATATCFKCRNTVVLGLTDRGAMLPLNPGPSETGALAVSVPGPGKAPRVRYLRGDDAQPAAGEQRMTAHWDTSPACKGERKARKRAATRAACKPHAAQVTQVPDCRDLTLDQLAAADLDTILARTRARRVLPERPAQVSGFSSGI